MQLCVSSVEKSYHVLVDGTLKSNESRVNSLSDYSRKARTAYRVYDSRWKIELIMRYYKQACEFDETRVHSNFSVIGSEFYSFLSTIITYRLLNTFDRANLLKKMNYKKICIFLCDQKSSYIRIDGNDWEIINW